MEFLVDYASFLAKTLTVVFAIVAVLIVLTVLRRGRGRQKEGHLEVHSLNDFYKSMRERLEDALMDKDLLKAKRKSEAKAAKLAKKDKETEEVRDRVFVLDFDGDIKASAVETLRHEITALLTQAKPTDEVVLRLESGGGMVHGYGLAASQLARIRQAGVPLTVCVDKVAASGGYMMACIGNKVLAAPFAILGSIGVVAQLPNVHRLLKKHDVDVEILTAGEYKRTLTVLGENTDKGREKFKEDLETTHQLFKDFVGRYRPELRIEEVATGEIWLGTDALDNRLVDHLATSDEYLSQRAREADLYQLSYVEKKSLPQRFGMGVSSVLDTSLSKAWTRLNEQRYLH